MAWRADLRVARAVIVRGSLLARLHRWQPLQRLPLAGLLPALALLPACSSLRPAAAPTEKAAAARVVAESTVPTLAALDRRSVSVTADDTLPPEPVDAAAVERAYRDALGALPPGPQRQEALRRLADLVMLRLDAPRGGEARADQSSAAPASNAAAPSTGAPTGEEPATRASADRAAPTSTESTDPGTADLAPAIALYRELLAAYPDAAGNDRVLYQLARAQELSGELDAALATLTRLVDSFPGTRYLEEAQFRRGELLFALRDYGRAEQAYHRALMSGPGWPYYERALYMHGWSQFKQGRLDDGLHSFFLVLDLGLAGAGGARLDAATGLSRADRELVEDTLRVTSLSLSGLLGAESIPPYMVSAVRRDYEFRIYQHLAELYLTQQRVKDAADTFALFAERHPAHPAAPAMQARVMEIYAGTGFTAQALAARVRYVERYGVGSAYQRNDPDGWQLNARPLVRDAMAAIARHHHASAQRAAQAGGESSAAGAPPAQPYEQAIAAYRRWLELFGAEAGAGEIHMQLADALFEQQRFGEAAAEYAEVALRYPDFARRADAAYAAVVAEVKQAQGEAAASTAASTTASTNAATTAATPPSTPASTTDTAAAAPTQPTAAAVAVERALQFAREFPQEPRHAAVLADAAERLFALAQPGRAAEVARDVLAQQPTAAPVQRRVAWTVLAQIAFDRAEYSVAEAGFAEALGVAVADDGAAATRAPLAERLAAAIYRQVEVAQAAGAPREAAVHFERVAEVRALAPQAPVRAGAQFDAAAAWLALSDWDAAARALEAFRRLHPDHPLQDEAGRRLARAYLEAGRWPQAAAEFERQAEQHLARNDAELARAALWQAAQLHEKAGSRAVAVRAYERYLARFPAPLEAALEARMRLAQAARAAGDVNRERALLREIQRADAGAGNARTARTRALGGLAALGLARPAVERYREVRLVAPLAAQLRRKKARMEEALAAIGAAAATGAPEAATAATYETAELYRDFARALLASQRPAGLKKDERVQYGVLLEEQAFPFEEKAIELHELNARRTVGGRYDDAVRASFAALAQLRPARYAKAEAAARSFDGSF